MLKGIVSQRTEGTPQDSPLSPLLSNIVLDEMDKELERRGHYFVRYADDCNIFVLSREAGERVMGSLWRFIEQAMGSVWFMKLKLYNLTSNYESLNDLQKPPCTKVRTVV